MSITHFSMAMNKESHNFFLSSRSLQKGDPFSRYLFFLAMEVICGVLIEASQKLRS